MENEISPGKTPGKKPKLDPEMFRKTPPKVVKAKPKLRRSFKPKVGVEEGSRRRRHRSDDLTPKKKKKNVVLRRHYSDNRFDASDLTDLLARRPISASLLTLPPLSSLSPKEEEELLSSPPSKETALKPSPSSPLHPAAKLSLRTPAEDLPFNLDIRLSEMLKEKYPTREKKSSTTTPTATTATTTTNQEKNDMDKEEISTTNSTNHQDECDMDQEIEEDTSTTTTKKSVRDMYMDVARRFTTNFFWKDPLGVRDHRHQIDILLAPPEMGEQLSDSEEEEEEEEEKAAVEKNEEQEQEKVKDVSIDSKAARRRASTFSNFLSSMFTPTKSKPKGAFERLSDKIEKYIAILKQEILSRKKSLESVNRSQRVSEREREKQMNISEEWHLRRDVRGIIESRGLHVMQLLNHMEHIHRLAIETMERRISITDGFQQYLVELKSADEEEKESTAKRLMEEQRTTGFYEKPRALLRREEQRQAMKEFVRHLESQILEASTTIREIHRLDSTIIAPISVNRRREELRTLVEKEGTLLVQLGNWENYLTKSSVGSARETEKLSMKNQKQFVSLLDPRTCLSVQGRLVRTFVKARDASRAAPVSDVSVIRSFVPYLALAIHQDLYGTTMRRNGDDEDDELSNLTESSVLLLVEALVHSQLPKGYCMSLDTEHAITLTARWKRQIGFGRGHDISKFNLPSNLVKMLKGSGKALYPESRNALSQMCRLQRSGPSALISALLRFVWILCAEYSCITSDSSIGADVLFPSFLYCIVHADVPNLPLIVEFMETYSYFETPTVKIHAEKGAYYFETLKAALTWVMELEEPEARRSLAVD